MHDLQDAFGIKLDKRPIVEVVWRLALLLETALPGVDTSSVSRPLHSGAWSSLLCIVHSGSRYWRRCSTSTKVVRIKAVCLPQSLNPGSHAIQMLPGSLGTSNRRFAMLSSHCIDGPLSCSCLRSFRYLYSTTMMPPAGGVPTGAVAWAAGSCSPPRSESSAALLGVDSGVSSPASSNLIQTGAGINHRGYVLAPVTSCKGPPSLWS
mmetsp:Transcript_106951/g.284587  ORF Transcript_106951/g.284587 Transcript_106951/m.284587 type:complete len:207 (+) Transcript_106951:142-762(+)